MEFEHIQFLKRTLIEEHVDTFTSRSLTFGVLLVDSDLTTAHAGFLTKFDELLDFFHLFTHRALFYVLAYTFMIYLCKNTIKHAKHKETYKFLDFGDSEP